MNEEKMTAEEWHDLIGARDQIFDDKKITLFSSAKIKVKWELYEEPTPKLIKGQRVLVWNHFDKDKRRRYFSHMENGQYQCFADGCDEWSSEGIALPWDHCKAWEEDDVPSIPA